MFSPKSTYTRRCFRTRALTILFFVTGTFWLMRQWPTTGHAVQTGPLPARWEQVGQLKFIAVNKLIELNGWVMTWTAQDVWRSYDEGVNWETVNEGLPARRGVAGIFAHGGRLFAFVNRRLYVSDSAGEFWDIVPEELFAVSAPVPEALAVRGGWLILGAARGCIYRSADGGQTWQFFSRVLPDTTVNDLAVVGNRLLAATARGVFISTDDGATWREPAGQIRYWLPGKVTIDAGEQVMSLTAVNTRVYAATWGGGVFRSEDCGETWEAFNAGLERDETYDSLYVGSFAPAGQRLLAGTRLGLFSTDINFGQGWNESNNGFARRSADGLFELNRQSYATNIGAGAFASKDNGLSWNAVTLSEDVARTTIGRVAAFHEANGKLWALSGGPDGALGVGYAFSTNDGASWTPMPQMNNNIRAQVAAFGHLYRATPVGVTRSEDDGATFDAFSQGLSITGRAPASVNTLAVNSARIAISRALNASCCSLMLFSILAIFSCCSGVGSSSTGAPVPLRRSTPPTSAMLFQ